MAEAYIVAATRTAGGRRNGRLSGWHPADMSGQVINELLKRSGVDPVAVDDVIWGCVGQAGQQAVNIARNAVLSSNLPITVPGTSVDRQCGSSQQALHFAAQAVMSGAMDIVIAGGVESMSRVPMGLGSTLPAKEGFGNYMSETMNERFNNAKFSQFVGAEMIAKKYGFSKQAMDEFSLESHKRAKAATEGGKFDKEILPLEARMADGTRTGEMHTRDEGIRMDATIESISGVKLISEDGRLTAASSSQICDGATGVMVVNEQGLKTLGVKPLARIHHMSVLGGDPLVMLDTPIAATERALKKAGMSINDIDLYEVNEAFASVPMAWLKALGADHARLNVHGGAIALGHPLGGSGTKLMSTLIYALQDQGKRYGLQTMCEGGGMANVTIIERL